MSQDMAALVFARQEKARQRRYDAMSMSEISTTPLEDVETPPSPLFFNSSRPPIQLEWHNIEYKVLVIPPPPKNSNILRRMMHGWIPQKKVPKTILYKMSGFVRPGSILAIMGQSGCGTFFVH
jgi:ABC-type glutathione transport system ATPase component